MCPKDNTKAHINITAEFPLEYFSLQLAYAKKATQISKISLDQALLEFTSFWKRIHDPFLLKLNQAEWSFDTATCEWRELRDRINNKEPADHVAYDLYLRNCKSNEEGKQYFGCFRYDLVSETGNLYDTIRIHFKNRDYSGKGPLSKERQTERLTDLKHMIAHIKVHHPEATTVTGGSWLYNLEAYQRLFPKAFTSNMKVEEISFPRSSGIWGQFLNSDGEINEEMRKIFIQKVNSAQTTAELLNCFKFKILFPRTGIENFYSNNFLDGQ